MSSFDWKKRTEGSINNRLILTATTIGIFFVLKAADVKQPKTSIDVIYIMEFDWSNM